MFRYKLLYPPLHILDALECVPCKKRLSGVKLLNPPGMERTLQSTRRMGYLAVDCFRAAACPRVMEEGHFDFSNV